LHHCHHLIGFFSLKAILGNVAEGKIPAPLQGFISVVLPFRQTSTASGIQSCCFALQANEHRFRDSFLLFCPSGKQAPLQGFIPVVLPSRQVKVLASVL